MNIRASSRAAVVIAAGLWICTSAPLFAAEGDAQAATPTAVGSAADTSAEPAKPARHHAARKTASKSHKSDRHAAKDSKDAKPPADETAKVEDPAPDTSATNMPPAVANANAQWPTQTPADTTGAAAQPGSFPTPTAAVQPEQPATAAPDNGANNAQVVAADQLNDLDRAISDDKPPLTLAKATIDTPEPEVAANTNSNSPWDKTSLIGKIFVACGGLLTMASAARMFMA